MALAPARLATVEDFPHVRAAHLAHLLADISAHPRMTPGWKLEYDKSNVTSWRYSVSYACGARCEGRASVEAHEGEGEGGVVLGAGGRRGGVARAHRVLVVQTHCARPPLLPLPLLCDEVETESLVTSLGADGAGARLQQRSRASCGALAALLGRCTGARALRDERAHHLRRLRELLHASEHRLAA